MNLKVSALASGDYRSAATTGNWNGGSVWEKYNGSSWVATGVTPTNTNGVITILNGHTITITGSVTVDQVVINSGGTVILNSGVTLTIASGTGTDFNVTGTFKSAGTVTINAGATIAYQSGGKYQHNFTTTAGTIPTATWNTGSTCEVIGYTSYNTANSPPGGLAQSFYNFKWNCTSQTGNITLHGDIATVNGDFTVASTGSGTLFLRQSGDGTTADLTIAGDLIIQAGIFDSNSSSSTQATISLDGSYNQSGGTFECSGNGGLAFNFTGAGQTFTFSSGTFNTSDMDIDVNSGASLTLSNNISIANGASFTVHGILDCDTKIISGSGTFTLSSGGGLTLASTSGITSSGSSGNIQTTSRSFSSTADYTYDAGSAQNSGSGLPSTVRNLTLNNAGGLTITNSVSVSGTLTFTSGNFTTGANTLTLGTSTGTLGTLSRTSGHVIGNFKRWIAAAATSNILFPVGSSTTYDPANYSFTVAPSTGGTITSKFTATNPGTSGFSLNDGGAVLVNIGYALWTSTTANGFAGGTFSLDLTATSLPGVTDYTILHLVRRTNSGSAWVLNGTHSAGTGSNAVPVIHRTGMTSHGEFGIASGAANPLPVNLVSFNAKRNNDKVELSWETASEINNDYFTVERSSDSRTFIPIAVEHGAGNSTELHDYSMVDYEPLESISFYRLRQTDYDGSSTVSDPVRVEANKNSSISAYPNPVLGNHLNLFLKNVHSQKLIISITAMNGSVVYEQELDGGRFDGNYVLPDLSLDSGKLYDLAVVTDARIYHEKILVLTE